MISDRKCSTPLLRGNRILRSVSLVTLSTVNLRPRHLPRSINASCLEAPIQTLWRNFHQKNRICVPSLGAATPNLRRMVQHCKNAHMCIQSSQTSFTRVVCDVACCPVAFRVPAWPELELLHQDVMMALPSWIHASPFLTYSADTAALNHRSICGV